MLGEDGVAFFVLKSKKAGTSCICKKPKDFHFNQMLFDIISSYIYISYLHSAIVSRSCQSPHGEGLMFFKNLLLAFFFFCVWSLSFRMKFN